MYNTIKKYFDNKKYQYHLFKILGYNVIQYKTFKAASLLNARNFKNWFFNNFYFPLIVVISTPLLLFAFHTFFKSIPYNKGIIEIFITGSITLLGLNVLRTSLTTTTEQLVMPDRNNPDLNKYDKLLLDFLDLRTTLDRRAFWLTFFGWIFYVAQIGQFVNNSNWVIYIFIILVLLLMVASVINARFIFIMKGNLASDDDLMRTLFGSLPNQTNDYDNLKNLFQQQSL